MRALALVFVTIFTCGCFATTYQPLNGGTVTGEGFFEKQLGPNNYEVSFRGNSSTSPERAIDFTLLRAAELCLLNGCSRFVVTSSEDTTMTAMSALPSETKSNSTVNIVGIEGASNVSMTTRRGAPRPTYVGTRPGHRMVVEFIEGGVENAQDPELVYDAESLNDSIRGKYKLKPFDTTGAARVL